jgi:hypothetical protein
MTWPDLVNGLFEIISGFMTFGNCFKLYKDKEVKGIMWQLTIFFTMWGFWNLFYYHSLNQICSMIGGAVLVTGNSIWVGQVLYYKNRKGK